MEPRSIRIPFSYVLGEDYDVKERYAFWDTATTLQWFKSHGYTLYHRIHDHFGDCTYPALPVEPCCEAIYPHTVYDTKNDGWEGGLETPLRASDESGKIAFAQDSQGRHVAIKLVRADTDEYRILEFLRRQELDTLKNNCLIPVLDILHIEGFHFAVMPRWGGNIHLPHPRYLHEVITIMRSMLKGLVFLHENGIAHGDLSMRNVLVNHSTDIHSLLGGNDMRQSLRSQDLLLYALFDFDCSILLPPGFTKENFRLPYQRSWGSFNMSNDTSAGKFDYNPFVLDVGTIGVEFCDFFQHLAPQFPLLAPLLDMMTTRNLDRRFTASEALQFLEAGVAQLSVACLNRHITILGTFAAYNEYDRWERLPAKFVEDWKTYKETPIPWSLKVLRNISSRKYFCHIVPWTRWFFFRVFSFPNTFFGRL